jgi:hypothetical protein
LLIQRRFTRNLTLRCFFEVGKNRLVTLKKMRHSPVAYRTFSAQVKSATQMYRVQTYRLFAKKNEEEVCVPKKIVWSLRMTHAM